MQQFHLPLTNKDVQIVKQNLPWISGYNTDGTKIYIDSSIPVEDHDSLIFDCLQRLLRLRKFDTTATN